MQNSRLPLACEATKSHPGWGANRLLGAVLMGCLAFAVSACDQGDREVTVTEKRSLTLWDKAFPNSLKDQPPLSWRRVAWTQMRLYNYRFGAEGDGEVWVSVLPMRSPDATLQNVNRWYGQFKLPEATSLETLSQKPMLGATGYLVEAEGTYHAGMGTEPRADTKMLAAAIPMKETMVTIKMIGAPGEVTAEQEEFVKYCQSLVFFDEAGIPEPEEEDE